MHNFAVPITALLISVIACIVPSSIAVSSKSVDAHTITGRVKLDGIGSNGFGLPAKISNTKVILNGGQRVTFVRPDGFFFSPVRVDISARNPGNVQAALTEIRKSLHELVLEPLREEQYYEIREPFSVMSLMKSPMGLMMGFMLLMVFVMPKMMENMDPEEIKKAQEEMRNQGGLAGLLAGAGGAPRSN